MLLDQTNHCYRKVELHLSYQILKDNWRRKKLILVTFKEKFQLYRFYLGSGYPSHPNLLISFLISLMTDSSNTLSEIPRQQSLYFKLECLWVKFYTIADNGLRKMTVTVDGRGLGSWRCDTLENYAKEGTPWALEIQRPEINKTIFIILEFKYQGSNPIPWITTKYCSDTWLMVWPTYATKESSILGLKYIYCLLIWRDCPDAPIWSPPL